MDLLSSGSSSARKTWAWSPGFGAQSGEICPTVLSQTLQLATSGSPVWDLCDGLSVREFLVAAGWPAYDQADVRLPAWKLDERQQHSIVGLANPAEYSIINPSGCLRVAKIARSSWKLIFGHCSLDQLVRV